MDKYNRPDVIITDFDRTLTYLYEDEELLIELAGKIKSHYENYIVNIDEIIGNENDGYHVWHKLHKVSKEMNLNDLNKEAEEIVTRFEIEVAVDKELFERVDSKLIDLKSKGIKLGVVSSNSTKVLEYVLKKYNILDMFEYVEGREIPFDPNLIKPSKYPVEKAVANMQCEKLSVWYVGDDLVDMISAKSAGLVAIGVCSGKYTKEELIKAGADKVFNTFGEITEVE